MSLITTPEGTTILTDYDDEPDHSATCTEAACATDCAFLWYARGQSRLGSAIAARLVGLVYIIRSARTPVPADVVLEVVELYAFDVAELAGVKIERIESRGEA